MLYFFLHILGNFTKLLEEMVDKKKVKALSKRLFDACRLLDPSYVGYKIIQGIKKENPGIKLSAGYFSKYKQAFKNADYIPQIKEGNYTIYLSYIDSILEKEVGYRWNGAQYEEISDFVKPTSNLVQQKIIDKCVGVWRGYSFNKEETESAKKTNPLGDKLNLRYNVYPLEIKQNGEVICETKNGSFKYGRVEQITEDKVFIQLQMDKRQIFLATKLKVLKHDKYTKLTLSYVDSGSDEVKLGVTIIMRVDKDFSAEDMKPAILKWTDFTEDSEEGEIITTLAESQIIPPNFSA